MICAPELHKQINHTRQVLHISLHKNATKR